MFAVSIYRKKNENYIQEAKAIGSIVFISDGFINTHLGLEIQLKETEHPNKGETDQRLLCHTHSQ